MIIIIIMIIILLLLLLLLLLLSLLLLLLFSLLLLLSDYVAHCLNSGFLFLRSSNNKFPQTSRTLRRIRVVCTRAVFSATLLSEFQYLFPLTNCLTLWVLFLWLLFTSGINLTFMFHIFLNSRAKFW